MGSQHGRDSAGEGSRIADRIISELYEAPMNTPGIRALRKRISKQLEEVDRKTVLSMAQELTRRAPFGRFVAYEIVQHHAATIRSITKKEVVKLGQGMKDWGGVDTFSCYIAGPAWHAGRITGATITGWARSEDRWWRRAALVSTVPLNSRKRAGAESVKQTLAICRLLASDRDDMVVKAMSWALRAVARRDPNSARKFLSEYRDKLAARVIREVENKLTTGLKNPRKPKATVDVSGPAALRNQARVQRRGSI